MTAAISKTEERKVTTVGKQDINDKKYQQVQTTCQNKNQCWWRKTVCKVPVMKPPPPHHHLPTFLRSFTERFVRPRTKLRPYLTVSDQRGGECFAFLTCVFTFCVPWNMRFHRILVCVSVTQTPLLRTSTGFWNGKVTSVDGRLVHSVLMLIWHYSVCRQFQGRVKPSRNWLQTRNKMP